MRGTEGNGAFVTGKEFRKRKTQQEKKVTHNQSARIRLIEAKWLSPKWGFWLKKKNIMQHH